MCSFFHRKQNSFTKCQTSFECQLCEHPRENKRNRTQQKQKLFCCSFRLLSQTIRIKNRNNLCAIKSQKKKFNGKTIGCDDLNFGWAHWVCWYRFQFRGVLLSVQIACVIKPVTWPPHNRPNLGCAFRVVGFVFNWRGPGREQRQELEASLMTAWYTQNATI